MRNRQKVRKNQELCITNEELRIQNEELCIQNDELCRSSMHAWSRRKKLWKNYTGRSLRRSSSWRIKNDGWRCWKEYRKGQRLTAVVRYKYWIEGHCLPLIFLPHISEWDWVVFWLPAPAEFALLASQRAMQFQNKMQALQRFSSTDFENGNVSFHLLSK